MRLFGRRRVSAEEAGARFVHECLVIARDRWPAVQGDLRPVIGEYVADIDAFLADQGTAFLFGLCAIGCELQATRSLLEEPVRSRVIAAAMSSLGASKELGASSTSLVELVDGYWQDTIEEGEIPCAAVPLLWVLDLDVSREFGGSTIHDPLALLAIESTVIQLGIGWWKQFLAKNQVI